MSIFCPTIEAQSLPGDANGDGKVDGIDYIFWLSNYNTNSSGGASKGDFNNDGKIDGVDYISWLSNYGKTVTPTPTSTATPFSGQYTATLNGLSEIPTISTNATGTATVKANQAGGYTLSLTFSGLTSAQTGATINGPASKGENAGPIWSLPNGQLNNYSFGLNSLQVQQLKNWQLYINVTTVNNPSGEIRGQLIVNGGPTPIPTSPTPVPVGIDQYSAVLRGLSVVPGVNTNAVGAATILINQSAVGNVTLSFSGLSSAVTAVHLHSPGGVTQNAAPIWTLPSGQLSNQHFHIESNIQDLKNGQMYIDVHTVSHPNGEIRGQFVHDTGGPIPTIAPAN